MSKFETVYPTVGARLAVYKRWQAECSYAAAGVGALLVVAGLASDSLKGAPPWFLAGLLTLAILAGGCLGRARVGIASAEQTLAGKGKPADENVPADAKSPKTDNHFMHVGVLLLLAMGCLLIVAAWWTVVAPHDDECTLKLPANQQAVVCTK